MQRVARKAGELRGEQGEEEDVSKAGEEIAEARVQRRGKEGTEKGGGGGD